MDGSERIMPASGGETTRATAYLPGLEIEILHRRAPDASEEHIAINLKAVPSFEAFGRYLEAANPLALWADLIRLCWLPWLSASHMLSGFSPLALPDRFYRAGERRD
ncbi:MAG TPA: hypothetical protein VNJ31_01360 [Methyloceanibacter sp.]|nr:hypothetical protein [Methyloceanibacter sp.]